MVDEKTSCFPALLEPNHSPANETTSPEYTLFDAIKSKEPNVQQIRIPEALSQEIKPNLESTLQDGRERDLKIDLKSENSLMVIQSFIGPEGFFETLYTHSAPDSINDQKCDVWIHTHPDLSKVQRDKAKLLSAEGEELEAPWNRIQKFVDIMVDIPSQGDLKSVSKRRDQRQSFLLATKDRYVLIIQIEPRPQEEKEDMELVAYQKDIDTIRKSLTKVYLVDGDSQDLGQYEKFRDEFLAIACQKLGLMVFVSTPNDMNLLAKLA